MMLTACSTTCETLDTSHLPNAIIPTVEEQKKLRKGRIKKGEESLSVYKSRLRPNLAELIKLQMANSKNPD